MTIFIFILQTFQHVFEVKTTLIESSQTIVLI